MLAVDISANESSIHTVQAERLCYNICKRETVGYSFKENLGHPPAVFVVFYAQTSPEQRHRTTRTAESQTTEAKEIVHISRFIDLGTFYSLVLVSALAPKIKSCSCSNYKAAGYNYILLLQSF